MEKLVDLVLLFAHFDERGLSVQESLNTAVSSTQPVNEVRYYQLSNFRSWTLDSQLHLFHSPQVHNILIFAFLYFSMLSYNTPLGLNGNRSILQMDTIQTVLKYKISLTFWKGCTWLKLQWQCVQYKRTPILHMEYQQREYRDHKDSSEISLLCN